MPSGLDNSILLRMQPPAKLMALARRHLHLLSQTSLFGTVIESLWCPIVAAGQDAIVFHNQRTHFPLYANRALRHILGDLHKILVPIWSIHFCFLLITDLIATTISCAVKPYLTNNSSGLPDSPNVSLMPTLAIGTGAFSTSTSATAPPNPPIIECSSTVTIAPVSAAHLTI